MPASNGRTRCPQCGRYFSSASMYDHYPRHHGIKWSVAYEEGGSEVPKEVPTPPPSYSIKEVAFNPTEPVTFTRLNGFILLEDSDGHIWIAERIR